MTDSRDLKANSIVEGRFRSDGGLGRGGFATVYRGEQLSIDRPVAIKVLDPVDRGSDDEDLRVTRHAWTPSTVPSRADGMAYRFHSAIRTR